MNIKTFQKEPTWSATYEIDWSDWLGSRTISASTWDVPSGISGTGPSFNTTAAFIIVSGGTWTQQYVLTNHVTANDGAIEQRSITFQIQTPASYCTLAEVRAMAQGMTTSGKPPATDDLIRNLIERVSRLLDLELGVPEGYFNSPIYPFTTAQIVYGDGLDRLKVPPYISGSLTTVTMPDGYTVPQFIEQEGYLVRSSNGVIDDLIANRGYYRRRYFDSPWPYGVPITITAQWGFEFTPSDIKNAVIEWIVNIWRETDPGALKLVGLDGQPLREDIPPRVKRIVSNWSLKTGGVFV